MVFMKALTVHPGRNTHYKFKDKAFQIIEMRSRISGRDKFSSTITPPF